MATPQSSLEQEVMRLRRLRKKGEFCGPYWSIPITQSEAESWFGPQGWAFVETVLHGGPAAEAAWAECTHCAWMLWLARKSDPVGTSKALFKTTIQDDIILMGSDDRKAHCDIIRKYLKCPTPPQELSHGTTAA